MLARRKSKPVKPCSAVRLTEALSQKKSTCSSTGGVNHAWLPKSGGATIDHLVFCVSILASKVWRRKIDHLMFRVSTWGDELFSLKSRKYLIYIFSIKDFKSIVVQVKIKMTVNHACVIFLLLIFLSRIFLVMYLTSRFYVHNKCLIFQLVNCYIQSRVFIHFFTKNIFES